MTSEIMRQERQMPGSALVGKPSGGGAIDTAVKGLYRQHVIIRFDHVVIDSDALDCEFDIPFDDNTEANEAEIVLYNLSYNTTNQIRHGGNVTVEAGYGNDMGILFTGKVSDKKIQNSDTDRVITVKAIDGAGLSDCEVEVEYCEGNTAQAILYDLCLRLGFPIAAWKPVRDYTYDRTVHVDGSIMDAVEKYAGVCGASAYVCRGMLYVQALSASNAGSFDLSVETGLLSAEEYEKTEKHEDFEDTVRGWELEMLLNHRIQTGTQIHLTSKRANGIYYVRQGTHNYDGNDMTTKVTAVER